MTEGGEFVKANFGGSFMQSLLNDDGMSLSPGTYVAMVDPIWDPSAEADPQQFKKILLDIYAPEALELEHMEH